MEFQAPGLLAACSIEPNLSDGSWVNKCMKLVYDSGEAGSVSRVTNHAA
jgi:hypothetical protein